MASLELFLKLVIARDMKNNVLSLIRYKLRPRYLSLKVNLKIDDSRLKGISPEFSKPLRQYYVMMNECPCISKRMAEINALESWLYIMIY